MKLLIGIIIGIAIVLSVKTVYAGEKQWDAGSWTRVSKITDGGVDCYVAESRYKWEAIGISCLKVK